MRTQILALASILLILVMSINVNQAFAMSMSEVPVLGDFVKVLTFRTYSVDDALYHAEIEAAGGHLGVDSGFIVKTETEKLLSIGQFVVNTVGLSSTVMHYDTIDKENNLLLTLPSLFKTEDYVEIISENIIDQMRAQMAEDDNVYYWVEDEAITNFTVIKPDQNFYISDQGKLVIGFDKYEVAPRYMGLCEFEIPSEILKDYLVSTEYIN